MVGFFIFIHEKMSALLEAKLIIFELLSEQTESGKSLLPIH